MTTLSVISYIVLVFSGRCGKDTVGFTSERSIVITSSYSASSSGAYTLNSRFTRSLTYARVTSSTSKIPLDEIQKASKNKDKNSDELLFFGVVYSPTEYKVGDKVIVNVNDTVSVNSNSLSVKETKRTRKKYEDTPEFITFWEAYPVHANKVGARQEFAKIDAPLDVLLESIEMWKRTDQWKKDGGQYIPYPAKWLKERRWEDSPKVNMPKSDGMERYSNLQRLAEEFDGE